MEHYFKGKNVEFDEVLDPELASVLPADVTWIRVKPGSKVHNLIGPAAAGINEKGSVVISGSGPAVTKVVSCAEVVKRRCKMSHQSTKLSCRVVEEHWEPTRDDLEPLKVTREMPNLQIALSKEPFENSQLQSKTSLESFLSISKADGSSARHRRQNKRSQNSKSNGNDAAKELGLENHKKKKPKNNRNGANNGGKGAAAAAGSNNDNHPKGQKSGSPTNEGQSKGSKGGSAPTNEGQSKGQKSGSPTKEGQSKGQKSDSPTNEGQSKGQKSNSTTNEGQKSGLPANEGQSKGQKSEASNERQQKRQKKSPPKSPIQNTDGT